MSIFQEVQKDGHGKSVDKGPDALQQFMADWHQAAKTLADQNEPLQLQNEKAEQKNEVCKTKIDAESMTFMAWRGNGNGASDAAFDRMMASADSGKGTRNLHDYNPEPADKVGNC